ncbi:transposable element Tcb1 transposase [Trichonephila clavipes]|nr:transposable element Tcb1 transposase [Trichonephila clavipes]
MRACGATSKRYLRLGDFYDFKFGNYVFLVVFSKNDQLCLVENSDQLLIKYPSSTEEGKWPTEIYCGLSFKKIGSRVGRNQTIVMRIVTVGCRKVRRTDVVDRIYLSAPLHQSGQSARRPLLGLPLTQNQRRLRRQWCDERWVGRRNEVVLTDESRICLQHHDSRIRVWRYRGERMLNSCNMHCHPGPAPGIMVWGGIGYPFRIPLVRIAGTLNSQRYISEVLEPAVLPYLQGLATAIFQQDNA